MLLLLTLTVLFFGTGQTVEQSKAVAQTSVAVKVQPKQKCTAHKAVKFYAGRIAYWQNKMRGQKTGLTRLQQTGCPRYLAHVLKVKAQITRNKYTQWLWYHYAWWDWLPDKWQRIGACETGYGKRPGQWTWNSGAYQGAFGFAVSSWDAFKPRGAPSEAYLATPRQQYQAALNIAARYGLSGWGCRNA